MDPARPTVRCLREDLQLAVPPVDEPLDETDHLLLATANEQFAGPNTSRERIRAVDDNVLFKVKVHRWRGAVWLEEELPWLVAAGERESGSPDDFYAALAAEVTAARKGYNAEHARALKTSAYSDYLLPNADDRERYRLEAGARFMRRLLAVVHDLLRASLRDGREYATEVGTFDLGIQVRADHGHETYVAVRITGSVPANLVMLIFDYVPGCDRGGWFPEDALPDRPLRSGEQAWSNIMDPTAAAKLLDVD
jgi:hypothetical protein